MSTQELFQLAGRLFELETERVINGQQEKVSELTLFPLEKKGAHDDDTDQEKDRLTAANSVQLEDWEYLLPFLTSPSIRENSDETNSVFSAVAGRLESPIMGAFVGNEGTGKDTGKTTTKLAGEGATTPFDGGPRNIANVQRGRDSVETARSECVLGLLESTPSRGDSGSVLDQSIADGYDLFWHQTPAARRQTCARGDFESLIGDLTPSKPTAERLEGTYPSSAPVLSSSPSTGNLETVSSKNPAGSSGSSPGDPVQTTTRTEKRRQPRDDDSSLAGDDANKNKLVERIRRSTVLRRTTLFPLEKKGAHDDDTDQEKDRLTAANSVQLEDWEYLLPFLRISEMS